MDAKITMSFDADVIDEAKQFADKHNISLSRLTEFLLQKSVKAKKYNIEELPIADWVLQLSEGKPEYIKNAPSSKQRRKEFYESKKSTK